MLYTSTCEMRQQRSHGQIPSKCKLMFPSVNLFTRSHGFPPLLVQIYGAVIGGHLSAFPSDIRRFGGALLEATISLHRTVCAKFLPTAVKFYYGFNLRDLSCLVQVLLTQQQYNTVEILFLCSYANLGEQCSTNFQRVRTRFHDRRHHGALMCFWRNAPKRTRNTSQRLHGSILSISINDRVVSAQQYLLVYKAACRSSVS